MLEAQNVLKVCKVFTITGKYLKLSSKLKVNIDNLKKSWSEEIISHLSIKINILGNPAKTEGPLLLVGNHISYLDIPVLLNSVPEISFVSKREVKSWPILGKAAIKGRTIFVERSCHKSRNSAKDYIAKVLIENKQKVVIFPSGTTSIKSSLLWKRGAFEIAENNRIMLQPFRLKYKPLRAAAYIDNDNLLIHMYKLLRQKRIEVTLEFHEPVFIKNIIEDCEFWKNWSE